MPTSTDGGASHHALKCGFGDTASAQRASSRDVDILRRLRHRSPAGCGVHVRCHVLSIGSQWWWRGVHTPRPGTNRQPWPSSNGLTTRNEMPIHSCGRLALPAPAHTPRRWCRNPNVAPIRAAHAQSPSRHTTRLACEAAACVVLLLNCSNSEPGRRRPNYHE